MAGYVLHLSEQENITLSAAVTRRLIDGGDGDAALLYLCLLKNRGSASPAPSSNGTRRAARAPRPPLPAWDSSAPRSRRSLLPRPSPRPPPSAPPIRARMSPAS